MAFLHALSGTFSLLLVVAVGYLLARIGLISAPVRQALPKLVTNVSLPPFLCCTIISSFTRSSLMPMLSGALLPLLSMSMLFAGAYATGKILRVPKRRFGLFCACVSNPNTIFIGIPVNVALFGDAALPYVLLYYIASTFFFWTVGNYFISRDESQSHQRGSAFQWQKLLSGPMYGFLSGLLLVALDWHPPEFLFRACSITGEMTTPLALIFIGATLQNMRLSQLRLGRDVIVALIGRMVASPILIWAMLPLFGLPRLMGNVFVIQSALPVLMQVAILSAYYDTDPDYGSIMVCLSTILCVATVPIAMSLL